MNNAEVVQRRMQRLSALSILVVASALSLAGCGGGESPAVTAPIVTPPPSPPAVPPAAYSLTVDANPLTATIVADSARAVTQKISRAGGVVQATGADGAVYTLMIPNNALAAETTITMTPLASLTIADLSADRSYGVTLAPEGQRFENYVTLTITPPAGVSAPVREQIPVAWSGASNVVSLALLDKASSEARFQLLHFSGYALLLATKGMDASLAAVRNRLGGTEEDRIASAAAERLARERQQQLAGSSEGGTVIAGFDDLRKEFVDKVLQPRLDAARSSCAAGRLASSTLVGYERQVQLLGLSEEQALYPKPFFTLLSETIESTAIVCMREEYELCRDEHIITRVLPVFFSFLRQAQLLGLFVDGNAPAWLMQAENDVRRCLQFELQFDSSMRFNSPSIMYSVSERVEARVTQIGYTQNFTTAPPAILVPRLQQVDAESAASIASQSQQPLVARDSRRILRFRARASLRCKRLVARSASPG